MVTVAFHSKMKLKFSANYCTNLRRFIKELLILQNTTKIYRLYLRSEFPQRMGTPTGALL